MKDELERIIARIDAKVGPIPEDPDKAQRKWEGRLYLAQVPERERDLLVKRVDKSGRPLVTTGKAMSEGMDRLQKGRAIVVWSGPTRTGKSVAAAWCLASLEEGAGHWIHASAYSRMAPWDNGFAYTIGVRNLAIDDLGLADENPKTRRQIESVLAQRFESPDKRTLITTNLTRDQFKKDFDDRVWSRIRQDGGWIALKDGDVANR